MSGWGQGAASHTPLVSFTRQGKCGEARSAAGEYSSATLLLPPDPVALFSRKKASSNTATLENSRPRAHTS